MKQTGNFTTTFGTIFGTRKLFSKKYTHAGSLINTTLPAYCMYHFTLQILQPSAQNPFRAEDFCSIIIEAQMLKHKSHRKPIEVPQISYSGRLICSTPIPSYEEEYFTQITPINHHFTNYNLHICKFFCTFAVEYCK